MRVLKEVLMNKQFLDNREVYLLKKSLFLRRELFTLMPKEEAS